MLLFPISLVGSNTPTTDQTLATTLELLYRLSGPPDRIGLPQVARGAALAVFTFCEGESFTDDSLSEFSLQLGALVQCVGTSADPLDMLPIRAREKTNPAWALFARISASFPYDALRIAGAEICLAMALRRPFRPHIARLLLGLFSKISGEGEATSSWSLGHLAQQITTEVYRAFASPTDPLVRQQLLAAERMIASMVGDFKQPTTTRHDAVDTVALLTDCELHEAVAALYKGVIVGDPVALLIVIAFCIGLPWEVVLDVPLSHRVVGFWVARVDVTLGCTEIEIRRALPELAAARPGHLKASTVLQRPLPAFAASALRAICARHPEATRLRDLIAGALPHARAPVPGTPTNCAIKITIARFCRSRGAALLRLGISRELATFAAFDLTLQAESKCHYVTLDVQSMHGAIAQMYASFEWREPVHLPESRATKVGAQVTPEARVVREVDERLRQAVENVRVGRRYTLHGLLAFHNAFAIFCASRAALFTSSRAARSYQFRADSFHPEASKLQVRDKRTKYDLGRAEVPLPAILAQQLSLYRRHLRTLGERLDRLQVPTNSKVRRRIDAALACESVPLFFVVTGGKIRSIQSQDVFQHATVPLKGDAFRHFMTNALTDLAVPSTEVDASQRRTDPSARSRRTSSITTKHEWFARVAKAMDMIALDLGFSLVNGLGRKE